MADKILFKKYSNRRLYNTKDSKYVTLQDVADMVKSGQRVEIIDAGNKEDVTAFILTQIVLEEARKRHILLPIPVLHLIIQYGDNILEEFFEKYFQKSIQGYLEYKKAFDDQFNKWLDTGMDMMKKMPNILEGAAPMENLMNMFSFPGGPIDQPVNNNETDPPNNAKKKIKK